MIIITASFFAPYCMNERTSWNKMLLQYFSFFFISVVYPFSKRKDKFSIFVFLKLSIAFAQLLERITRHNRFPKN